MNTGCQIISTRRWTLPRLWSVRRSSLWIHTMTSRPGFCSNAQPWLRPRTDPTGQKLTMIPINKAFHNHRPVALMKSSSVPIERPHSVIHGDKLNMSEREGLVSCDEPYHRFLGGVGGRQVFLWACGFRSAPDGLRHGLNGRKYVDVIWRRLEKAFKPLSADPTAERGWGSDAFRLLSNTWKTRCEALVPIKSLGPKLLSPF